MTATSETILTTRRDKPPVQRTPRARTARSIRYLLLFLSLVVVLMPAYVLFITSFKTLGDTNAASAWSPPTEWTTAAWSKAWDTLSPSLWRTIQIAVPGALISSLLGSTNGFVLARWRFPGANIVFALILFGMFIPYQAIMIPLRNTLQDFGIPSGVWTLMFVHIIYGIPICTLIFRNYYATTVPHELIEAARVDGAGVYRTYAMIILPLSAAGFVVTIIWQFTSIWNDFLFAIFLTNANNGPITIGLSALAGGQITDYAASMAGALISAFPTLLVYIVLGRWFIGGLMAGALKG